MARTKGRRPLTCHHEAGHALVRWSFGYHTDRAVVQTVEAVLAGKRVRDRRGRLVTCEGIVTGYDICGWPFGRLKISGNAEDQAECDRVRAVSRDIELINCYAGFYDEATYTRRSVGACMLAGGRGPGVCARALASGGGGDQGDCRRPDNPRASIRGSDRSSVPEGLRRPGMRLWGMDGSVATDA